MTVRHLLRDTSQDLTQIQSAIALGDYSAWLDSERIAVNVSAEVRGELVVEFARGVGPNIVPHLRTLLLDVLATEGLAHLPVHRLDPSPVESLP